MAEVRVTSERPAWGKLGKEAGRILTRSLFLLGERGRPVELSLVSAPVIRRLNERYRGKRGPTNVLSFSWTGVFPYARIPSSKRPLGEIIIAPAIAWQRGDWFPLLVVHGLLHLLGYTHEKAHDKIRMERVERRLLRRLYSRFFLEP